MLRSEFRFRIERWPQRLLGWLLGEAFLGFLAIIAVALTLFPMLFRVGPGAHAAIDLLQWIVVGWFAFEYGFAFASAEKKREFLFNPWRVLDLATVLIPLATLLPTVSAVFRSSPVLRLVRLVRIVTLGVRVSGISVRRRVRQDEEEMAAAPTQITVVSDSEGLSPGQTSRPELLQWLKKPGHEWYHVASPSPDELREFAAASGLPATFLETHLLNTNYPHLATAGARTALYVHLPDVQHDGHVERHGVLFVATERGLLSLSRYPVGAVERLPAPAAGEESRLPFPARVMSLVLDRVLRENERLAGRFEEELHVLEELPVRDSRPAFFERTFRLKKELSAAQGDLWRLKGALADLGEGRVQFPSGGPESADGFRRLAATADYLYETIVNTREEVLGLIDLHLNVVSFEMNRVMRVLAVVSVLGLIPAVVGGLFGMNLIDNPWPFTLPQVAYGVCFGMVLCLYFFFVKGWLR